MKDKVLYNIQPEKPNVPKESMHKSYGPIYSTRDRLEMWALSLMDGIKQLFSYLGVIAFVAIVWVFPAMYALCGEFGTFGWAFCIIWSCMSAIAFTVTLVTSLYEYLKERKILREKRGLCG